MEQLPFALLNCAVWKPRTAWQFQVANSYLNELDGSPISAKIDRKALSLQLSETVISMKFMEPVQVTINNVSTQNCIMSLNTFLEAVFTIGKVIMA